LRNCVVTGCQLGYCNTHCITPNRHRHGRRQWYSTRNTHATHSATHAASHQIGIDIVGGLGAPYETQQSAVEQARDRQHDDREVCIQDPAETRTHARCMCVSECE